MKTWYYGTTIDKRTGVSYDIDVRSGSKKAREILVERYLDKNNGKETYQRVVTYKRLNEIGRTGLSIVLQSLRDACPIETGYGRLVGIRYKPIKMKNGALYQMTYTIIVGSEHTARNHQVFKTPYIAFHNSSVKADERQGAHEGWIDTALTNAKSTCNSMGIKMMHNYGPTKSICAYYSGGVFPAGYRFRVTFYQK